MRRLIWFVLFCALAAMPGCRDNNDGGADCDPTIDVVTLGKALPPCPQPEPKPCHGKGCD